MYLIVGLGNPEPEYSNTRHNMGFDVINKLSEKYKIDINKNGFQSFYGIGMIEEEKIILCKPQTFMNLSGESIVKIANFYKIDHNKIIVIYDDIDIEPGKIRIRNKGSSGGHNGIKSVLNCLGTDQFIRIRIGTGNPKYKNDLINYVLKKLNETEKNILTEGINKGVDAIGEIIKNNSNKEKREE